MFEYLTVTSDHEYKEACNLFLEYAKWLNIDLGFQNFEKELETVSTMYGGATGAVILCRYDETAIACAAVRKIEEGICELKRMYVKPEFRKKGIGEELLNRALDFSGKAGYQLMRLDTLDHMSPAMNLYQKKGFRKIDAYYHNPIANAVYFEKRIQ